LTVLSLRYTERRLISKEPGIFQDDKGVAKKIVVSVKGGQNISVQMIRDLRGVIERDKASMGLFVTLEAPRRVLYIQGSELSPDDRSGGNAFRDRAAPGPCWLLQASLKSGVAPSQPGTGPARLLGLLGRVPHRIRRRWRARWPRGRGRRHTIEAARESAAPSQIRERCRRHSDKHAGNSRRGTAGPGHATSGVRSPFPRDYFRSYCHRENVVLRRVGSGLEHVTGLTLESHQAKAREPVECA
jgi:hypothetical protein